MSTTTNTNKATLIFETKLKESENVARAFMDAYILKLASKKDLCSEIRCKGLDDILYSESLVEEYKSIGFTFFKHKLTGKVYLKTNVNVTEWWEGRNK